MHSSIVAVALLRHVFDEGQHAAALGVGSIGTPRRLEDQDGAVCMGACVAAEASVWLDAHGVFLLAPAVYMPDYPTQAPALLATDAEIVH